MDSGKGREIGANDGQFIKYHTGLYLFSGHRHIHWILEAANKNIGGGQYVKKSTL